VAIKNKGLKLAITVQNERHKKENLMVTSKNKSLSQPVRFEITVSVVGGMRKHICAAHEEEDAVKRILRSYAGQEPNVVRVTYLGVIPFRRENLRAKVWHN
jgi:hypothetical protein